MRLRPTPALCALLAFLLFESAWIAWVLRGDRTIDYYAYDIASLAMRSGLNPYELAPASLDALALARGLNGAQEIWPYLYPPLLATLLLPLQTVPVRTAAALWSLFNLLALTLSGLLLSQLASGRWLAPRVFFGLMLFVPVLTTFYAGQVNHLMLLSLSAAAWALSRRRAALGGVALAAGILVKLMPISVAAVLLMRKSWRVLAWLTVAAVLMVALTLPWAGLENWLYYARQAFGLASAGTPVAASNQSLAASAMRLLGPATGPAVGAGLAWLVIAITALAVWRVRDREVALLPSLALAVSALALAAPLSWVHHQVLLALPFVLLLRSCEGTPRQALARAVVIVCMVALNVLGLAWKVLQAWPIPASIGSMAMLMLWLALLREVLTGGGIGLAERVVFSHPAGSPSPGPC